MYAPVSVVDRPFSITITIIVIICTTYIYIYIFLEVHLSISNRSGTSVRDLSGENLRLKASAGDLHTIASRTQC